MAIGRGLTHCNRIAQYKTVEHKMPYLRQLDESGLAILGNMSNDMVFSLDKIKDDATRKLMYSWIAQIQSVLLDHVITLSE